MKRPQYFAAKPLQDTDITVHNEIELWRAVLDVSDGNEIYNLEIICIFDLFDMY